MGATLYDSKMYTCMITTYSHALYTMHYTMREKGEGGGREGERDRDRQRERERERERVSE